MKRCKNPKYKYFHRIHLELITTHTPVPMKQNKAKPILCIEIFIYENLSYKLLNLNGESISLDVNKQKQNKIKI